MDSKILDSPENKQLAKELKEQVKEQQNNRDKIKSLKDAHPSNYKEKPAFKVYIDNQLKEQ